MLSGPCSSRSCLPVRPLRASSPAPSFASSMATLSKFLHDQHPERIRLSGIDCPEKDQSYGQKAKYAASALVFGKEVTLQTFGKDKYGGAIGDVHLPDGMNLNH